MSLPVGRAYGRVPSLWGGALIVFTAIALSGCNSEQEEMVPSEPPAIAFEGKVDPALVGQWETESKLSSLDLGSDGAAAMTNVAPGRGTSTAKGEWRVSEKRLLFRLEGADRVTVYEVEYEADKLHLKQKSTKLDIEYLRKKAVAEGKKS